MLIYFTVVLATHRLEYLNQFDRIYQLQGKSIEEVESDKLQPSLLERAEIEDQEFVEAKAKEQDNKEKKYSLLDVQAADFCKYLTLSGRPVLYSLEIAFVFIIGIVAMVLRSYTSSPSQRITTTAQ